MHTQADIVLAEDGRNATLHQGGKQVEVSILAAPEHTEFIVMDADRLPSSPGPTPGERGAQGYRKLAIRMKDVVNVQLAVALIPEGGQGVTHSQVSRLSTWRS